MTAKPKVNMFTADMFKRVLKQVVEEHGSETFISDGYAPHDDIINGVADIANKTLEETGLIKKHEILSEFLFKTRTFLGELPEVSWSEESQIVWEYANEALEKMGKNS